MWPFSPFLCVENLPVPTSFYILSNCELNLIYFYIYCSNLVDLKDFRENSAYYGQIHSIITFKKSLVHLCPLFYLCSLVFSCVLLVFHLCSTCVHLCSLVFTCVHLCSLVFTCVHLCSLVFTCVHLCSLVFTCVHLCLLVFTCVPLVFTCVHLCSTCVHLCSFVFHLCSLVFICVHLCSSVFICVHLCSSVFICVHLCSSVFICVLLVFICVHLCSLVFPLVWCFRLERLQQAHHSSCLRTAGFFSIACNKVVVVRIRSGETLIRMSINFDRR